MPFPKAVEQVAKAYVERVRDMCLKRYIRIVRGDDASVYGRELHARLAGSGLSPAQRGACQELVWAVIDETLSEVLAFVEYQVSAGNLEVVVIDQENGESYRVKRTDMIAAEFCSGDDTWVEKYSAIKQPNSDDVLEDKQG